MNKLRLPSSRPSKPPAETEPTLTEPSWAVRLQTERLRTTSRSENPCPPSNLERLSLPEAKPERILCFDIENKPGTYGGGDYTFPKVTAIGAKFLDQKQMHVWCLDRSKPRERR